MPYVSDAQIRFFHSPSAAKAGITQEQVKEYDQASKGMELPDRSSRKLNAMRKIVDQYGGK